MSVNAKEIEAVWQEFNVQDTGRDMTNECRLATVIITLRAENFALKEQARGDADELEEIKDRVRRALER